MTKSNRNSLFILTGIFLLISIASFSGIIDDSWLYRDSNEMMFSKTIDASLTMLLSEAYMSESSVIMDTASVGFVLTKSLIDPDLIQNSGDEFSLNTVNFCTFHSAEAIPEELQSCIICILGDDVNPQTSEPMAAGQFDLPTGYTPSSTIMIEITSTAFPGANSVLDIVNAEIVVACGPEEGCTPGYWKQSQHFDSWVTYNTSDFFDEVFGVGPHITLLEALSVNGGGENALARHAVGGLLSAASPDVVYDLLESEVISMTQDAFNGISLVEETKDLFDLFNNAGCPLN